MHRFQTRAVPQPAGAAAVLLATALTAFSAAANAAPSPMTSPMTSSMTSPVVPLPVAGDPAACDVVASPYDPPWADVAPLEVISFDHDPILSDLENGAALAAVIDSLTPGQRLEVGTGTYSMSGIFSVSLVGTADAPIWIVAQEGAEPVITRPNASQNVMNVGELVKGSTHYVCFRGIEFTGGSLGVRLHQVSHFWLDRCHIHHTAGGALTANIPGLNTHHLYITRNEIHDTGGTGGTGECMYLGGNNGNPIMAESVIALNHVYDCGGSQGDGIEVKQGSWGNWIVQNEVHDCNYPCLLVYGTGGLPVNVIERNVLYRSNDNVLQVQGEADVFNNLIMDGANGFHSHDHQGQTRDLKFENNTVINSGRGLNLVDWDGRPGMFLVNNAVYSQLGQAVRFQSGSSGVEIARNVVLGPVAGGPAPDPDKFANGSGLADFENVTWDATQRNARPAAGGPLIEFAVPFFVDAHDVDVDLNGQVRDLVAEVGCYERDSWGCHYGSGEVGPGGQLPYASVNQKPLVGTSNFVLFLEDGPPNATAVLVYGLEPLHFPLLDGNLWVLPFMAESSPTDAQGAAAYAFPIPPKPALDGLDVYLQWLIPNAFSPSGVAFSGGLHLQVTIQ